MTFSITHITPSRIDILYEEEHYSIHGEALDKSVGGLDYVINARDFHYSDDDREFEPIPVAVRLAVIEALKAELQRRDWAFEVEGEDALRA